LQSSRCQVLGKLCKGMGTVIGTAEGCKTRSSAVPRHAEDAADTLLGRVALAEFAVLMRGVDAAERWLHPDTRSCCSRVRLDLTLHLLLGCAREWTE
jgi:hypothetical protein